MTGGKLPGVSNMMKMIENVFSQFQWNKWMEISGGNVTSQALSVCLAESQFEGCAA
jgi:hypothetical protein